MSDKITVEKFEGDNCKELKSCQTWFDLSSTMENILEFGVLRENLNVREGGARKKNRRQGIVSRAIGQTPPNILVDFLML